jgi:hypothetical protein
MYIKIQTERELTLLSRLNSWLGKNRVPLELLECVENLLKPRLLGKKGFVAIIPNVTEGKLSHIQELLNVGQEVEVQGVAERIEVADKGTWLSKKRQWHRVVFGMGRRNKIYVLYSTKQEKRW